MLYSYLNNQHIRKQKISEAELNYGSLVIDHAETMKEIGELGLDIWRRQMIEPLKDELVRLLLDGIRYDRLGSGSGSTERTQFQADSTIKGVISSFVEVEEYKKKGNLDVRYFFLVLQNVLCICSALNIHKKVQKYLIVKITFHQTKSEKSAI